MDFAFGVGAPRPADPIRFGVLIGSERAYRVCMGSLWGPIGSLRSLKGFIGSLWGPIGSYGVLMGSYGV